MRFLQSIGCLTPVAIVMYGIVGALLLWQFGGQAVNYLGSMGWEQASGTIIFSEVESAWDTTGERYLARVVYTYEIDGETYQGDQLDLRAPTYVRSRDDAEQILAPYPIGASVTLYVDPSDPSRTVLTRDMPGAVWVFVGVGSAFVLFSVGFGIQTLVRRRQSPLTATMSNEDSS